MAFAGLDVGTSRCKLLVYDLDGNILFSKSRSYKETGDRGLRELDPEKVIIEVKEVLKDAGRNCPVKIEALAVTSLGESIVCLDKDGRSLANSMLTGDRRGIEEAERLAGEITPLEVMEITGLPLSEMYGLPKYMWLNENTNAIKDANAIFFYEDYVGYMLTGKRIVSYSSAARSMAFDINKKQWSEKLLSYAGIRMEQMSTPVESGTVIGTVLPEIAKELHINEDMKIVVGGHDQSCAALGSGLTDPSVCECGMGTCEFMYIMLPKAVKSQYMIENSLTCVPYFFPETYLTSLEVTTCGILKNWSRETILKGIDMECRQRDEDFYAYIDKAIDNIRTDVMVLPQFGSSGNPDNNYDVKGTITGLTVHTRPEEIYRAILEGIVFQMYLSYETALQIGVKPEKIIATGGGAMSDVNLQIHADIFNMNVVTTTSVEAGALACMILAATGVNAYPSLKEGMERAIKVKKEIKPDREMHEYYMEKYEKFKKLYESMHLF
ncbi:MAG: hypothetical protein GX494_05300 [Clostridiaceae bacterium]|nr:hypothetical protein [Clostridiaceae bacterium]